MSICKSKGSLTRWSEHVQRESLLLADNRRRLLVTTEMEQVDSGESKLVCICCVMQ